jgi:hypothetical protein
MKMSSTSIKLIETLQELSESSGKIYIADSLDEAIATSILKYFDNNHIDDAIQVVVVYNYLRDAYGFTVTMKEFANKVPGITQGILRERKALDETKKLMKETAERMKEV